MTNDEGESVEAESLPVPAFSHSPFGFDSSFIIRTSSFPSLYTPASTLPTIRPTKGMCLGFRDGGEGAADRHIMSTLLQPSTAIDPDTLNPVFEKQHPRQICEWAAAEFGDGLVMTS